MLNAYARRLIRCANGYSTRWSNWCHPDDIAWGTLLNAYGGDAVGAQRVFDQMVKADTPNEIACTLLNAYARRSDPAGAQRVFDQMLEATTPNEITWRTLMNAYARDGLTRRQQRYSTRWSKLVSPPTTLPWDKLVERLRRRTQPCATGL